MNAEASARVVFIGLDGATFSILDPLMQDGTMPFLAKFTVKGVRAVLHSTPHPLTPPAWTSMVTGRSPGEHGIFDFVKIDRRGDHPGRFAHAIPNRKSEAPGRPVPFHIREVLGRSRSHQKQHEDRIDERHPDCSAGDGNRVACVGSEKREVPASRRRHLPAARQDTGRLPAGGIGMALPGKQHESSDRGSVLRRGCAVFRSAGNAELLQCFSTPCPGIQGQRKDHSRN